MAKTTGAAGAANTNETKKETTTKDEAGTVMLKLVGAATYHCHKVSNDVIQKGQIIEVDAATAELLLDDTYVDSLNNEHPYFVETSAEEEAAKSRRAARRAAKQTTESDEDEEQ